MHPTRAGSDLLAIVEARRAAVGLHPWTWEVLACRRT